MENLRSRTRKKAQKQNLLTDLIESESRRNVKFADGVSTEPSSTSSLGKSPTESIYCCMIQVLSESSPLPSWSSLGKDSPELQPSTNLLVQSPRSARGKSPTEHFPVSKVQKTNRQLRVTWSSTPVSARSMSQRGEQKKDPSPKRVRPSDKRTSSDKVELPVTRNCERCRRHHLAKVKKPRSDLAKPKLKLSWQMKSLISIAIDNETTWSSPSTEPRLLNPRVAMVLESLHAKKRERLQTNIIAEYREIRKRVDQALKHVDFVLEDENETSQLQLRPSSS